MHWVIDRSLGRRNALGQGGEAGYEHLIETLERTQTSYSLVRKIPFSGVLIHPDDEGPDHKPITLEIEGRVFVCGTLSMKATAEQHGWTPGYVDGADQEELIAAWGSHMLNHTAVIGKFSEVEPPAEEFFARPVDDSKSFAGTTFTRPEWIDWKSRVMDIQNSGASIRADDLVMLAPLQKIFAEYRLFVINGKIVTGSRYKLGSRVFYTTDLPPDMLDYARSRLAEYCPRRALCLDIAHIDDDDPFRVIETNSISSAGFYACDMNVFVNAINAEYEND